MSGVPPSHRAAGPRAPARPHAGVPRLPSAGRCKQWRRPGTVSYVSAILELVVRVAPRRVLRVALGNALEMYDFQIFGYYAPAIAATFFPNSNAFASLMLSLATFGAGFLMRPIGAVIRSAKGACRTFSSNSIRVPPPAAGLSR